MIENILNHISDLSPILIYLILFLFSYVENVFPPSPSDLVVVIGGSLIATGPIHFVPTLIFTTIGSILGFMTLYFIGSQLDKKVVRAGKIKFITAESVAKAENWFAKYGYTIIAINRFLPGTRSVISFFAGLSELKVLKTIVLATLSAAFWNTIMIYLGIIFGDNIDQVDLYLSRYEKIVLIITGVVVLFFVIRYSFFKKKKSTS